MDWNSLTLKQIRRRPEYKRLVAEYRRNRPSGGKAIADMTKGEIIRRLDGGPGRRPPPGRHRRDPCDPCAPLCAPPPCPPPRRKRPHPSELCDPDSPHYDPCYNTVQCLCGQIPCICARHYPFPVGGSQIRCIRCHTIPCCCYKSYAVWKPYSNAQRNAISCTGIDINRYGLDLPVALARHQAISMCGPHVNLQAGPIPIPAIGGHNRVVRVHKNAPARFFG